MAKAKKEKKKKIHTIKIDTHYNEDLKEEKNVLLDGESIFLIDTERYMGHRRDQMNDVVEVINKKFKSSITKDDLRKALMFGTIEL